MEHLGQSVVALTMMAGFGGSMPGACALFAIGMSQQRSIQLWLQNV
jgi:hypothetical protein